MKYQTTFYVVINGTDIVKSNIYLLIDANLDVAEAMREYTHFNNAIDETDIKNRRRLILNKLETAVATYKQVIDNLEAW